MYQYLHPWHLGKIRLHGELSLKYFSPTAAARKFLGGHVIRMWSLYTDRSCVDHRGIKYVNHMLRAYHQPMVLAGTIGKSNVEMER